VLCTSVKNLGLGTNGGNFRGHLIQWNAIFKKSRGAKT
jgi:hypothetical protein